MDKSECTNKKLKKIYEVYEFFLKKKFLSHKTKKIMLNMGEEIVQGSKLVTLMI